MSDDESQTTAGSNDPNVVGRSSANGGATENQPGQASISISTRVQNVLSRSTDLPDLLENSGGINPPGLHQQAATLSDTGQPICGDNSPPACVNSSVILPSASRFHFTFNLLYPPYHCQAVDDDINNHNHSNNAFCESAFAVLIGGRDVASDNFTRACSNDVAAVKEIFSKMIPRNNIYTITPDANSTEEAIEYLYLYIKRNKPRKLFLYFSGHNVSSATNRPYLNVSSEQGNALDIERLKMFIEGLLPGCTELIIILDCCSAGQNIILPMLPANMMTERTHVQWSSSKAGGKSYLYATGESSVFTSHIISALTGASTCPNRDINCPLCSRLRSSILQNGYVDLTSLELLEYVHEHLRHSSHRFSFLDLPQYVRNPVTRD